VGSGHPTELKSEIQNEENGGLRTHPTKSAPEPAGQIRRDGGGNQGAERSAMIEKVKAAVVMVVCY
jgi:hypothetical protein